MNLGFGALNTIILRLVFPISAVGLAESLESKKLGLLGLVELPLAVEILIAVVLLDLVIYLQHLAFHHIEIFWRLHRFHHSDLDFDVTTANRFHPLEILLSMLIKFATIVALGVPAYAVLIFEVVLNASAMFNHANINIPERLDRLIRSLLVTPDMHRIHHSSSQSETNSNFGFCLSIWDRIFKTYRPKAKLSQTEIQIGLEYFRSSQEQSFLALLFQPFQLVNYKPQKSPDETKRS